MESSEDFSEPADLLLHDLRRFLHNAKDQQEILYKISKLMARSANHMKEHEGTLMRVLKDLQKQVDSGVVVHINADLKAHTASVSTVTAPLVRELQSATKVIRHFGVTIALSAFIAGISGTFLGIFTALRLL
tara:strand:- start:311 stop:706 length:396 start_codon:yes stop_codon:yes gene_type:complete